MRFKSKVNSKPKVSISLGREECVLCSVLLIYVLRVDAGGEIKSVSVGNVWKSSQGRNLAEISEGKINPGLTGRLVRHLL